MQVDRVSGIGVPDRYVRAGEVHDLSQELIRAYQHDTLVSEAEETNASDEDRSVQERGSTSGVPPYV